MNLLLDTHVFLWWIAGDSLPQVAEEAIRHPNNTVWISAASVWEITIKASLGKLKFPAPAVNFVEAQRMQNGFGWLPLEAAALNALLELPFHHRDPFDRLLIAQAIARDYTFVSADNAVGQYSVRKLWS